MTRRRKLDAQKERRGITRANRGGGETPLDAIRNINVTGLNGRLVGALEDLVTNIRLHVVDNPSPSIHQDASPPLTLRSRARGVAITLVVDRSEKE